MVGLSVVSLPNQFKIHQGQKSKVKGQRSTAVGIATRREILITKSRYYFLT
jgi:hypothetical protein